ncbi:MAG: DUF6155 family protein [Bacteroidota bacterium]
MGFSEIKKELKKLEKDRIIDLISDLYKKNNAVKEYLDFYTNPNEKEILIKYKVKVYEAFYPKRGYGFKLSNGKKAISDFKKLEPSKEYIADLMLYYVETGVIFTNEFGDIDEPFYNSMESVFHQALKLMEKESILELFKDRAQKVVKDTSGIGWGFHDGLSYTYYEFYH